MKQNPSKSTQRKHHIVAVINDLKGNGAERVVITLAREFVRMGHQCEIICFNETIEYDITGLSVHFFSIKYWRWLPRRIRGKVVSWMLDRKIYSLTQRNPDLILSNLLPCDRIMSESRLRNVYFVIHNVLSLERNVKQGFDELKIYEKKPAICVSHGVRKDLIHLIPCQAESAVTIHNPIDVEFTNQLANIPIQLVRNKYVIHVGKFKNEKRHDVLLRAFAKSSYKGDLVLVGQGPLMQKNRELAKKLGIDNRVHFIGYQPNPFPFIKKADLLVLTSDFEGFGMVLVEAISLDVPVISTDCPSGPSEILEDHQLFKTGAVDELASMLSEDSFDIFKTYLKNEFHVKFAAEKYLSLSRFTDY